MAYPVIRIYAYIRKYIQTQHTTQKHTHIKTHRLTHACTLHIHHRLLDLTSLASVRAFADGYIAAGLRLDVLILNVGMTAPHRMTKDGIEMVFQVSHSLLHSQTHPTSLSSPQFSPPLYMVDIVGHLFKKCVGQPLESLPAHPAAVTRAHGVSSLSSCCPVFRRAPLLILWRRPGLAGSGGHQQGNQRWAELCASEALQPDLSGG